MNNVLFRKGDQSFIDENVPLADGQIIFNETDEAIYVDNTINGSVVRKRYAGGNLSRSDVDSTLSSSSTNPIQNQAVANAIGSLSSLETTAKSNLVNAVNEVQGEIINAETHISNETTARQLADSTLQSNINSEVSTRASADNLLQSQINQLVTPSGTAPNPSEIENARIGADGVTYSTLGEAIRRNDNLLNDALQSSVYEGIVQGAIVFGTGQFVDHNRSVRTGFIKLSHINNCYRPSSYKLVFFYYSDASTNSYLGQRATSSSATGEVIDKSFILSYAPSGTKYVAVRVNKFDGDTEQVITPSVAIADGVVINVAVLYNYKEIENTVLPNKYCINQLPNITAQNKNLITDYDDYTASTSNIAIVINNNDIIASASETNASLMYTIIDNITNEDIGRTFTISCKIKATESSDCGIGFFRSYTIRAVAHTSSVSDIFATYTIRGNDVGKPLRAFAQPLFNNTADYNKSVTFGDLMVEESAKKTNYVAPGLTAYDEFSRDKIAMLGISTMNIVGQYTDGFTLTYENQKKVNYRLKSRAKYIGSNAPTIRFISGYYTSPQYTIGMKDSYDIQEWRIPLPINDGKIQIIVTIPSGTTLNIDFIQACEDTSSCSYNNGLRFNSHLGFISLAPENTIPAFELAGQMGYEACIVVPKVTSDGVIVCIHDDTINRTARDANGDRPTTDMAVRDMTYEQLLQWDFGRYYSDYYIGTKIPTLDEFLDVCARYRMKPMFSTHPSLTVAQWWTVRNKLIKHGLLKSFHVKAFNISILETAFSVLGDSIDGYTGEYDGANFVSIEAMNNFVTNHNIDTSKTRIALEVVNTTVDQTIVENIINQGYIVAHSTLTKNNLGDSVKQMIKWGVTEFTDDCFCVTGLNW